MYSVEKTQGINLLHRFDYVLMGSVLLLTAIGLLVLDSATLSMSNGPSLMKRQILSIILGVIVCLVINLLDYKDFKIFGIIFYFISVALLVYVLLFKYLQFFGNQVMAAVLYDMIY